MPDRYLAVHANGEGGRPAEGAAVMAAGGARPAEGVPTLRHHGIHLVGEANAAAVRLLGRLALRLQACYCLQGMADFQMSALRACCTSCKGTLTWASQCSSTEHSWLHVLFCRGIHSPQPCTVLPHCIGPTPWTRAT